MLSLSWKKLVAISLMLASAGARAELDITITDGLNDARPIAVVPFSFQGLAPTTPGSLAARAPHDIAEIVANDLERSGKFRPLSRSEMPELPHQGSELLAARWREKGIEAVVVGNVRELSAGQYEVSYELLDVFNGKNGNGISSPGKPVLSLSVDASASVLLTKKNAVGTGPFRMHAHRIADQIYEKLTGERGAFATYIAYVSVERGERLPFKLIVADSDDFNPRVVLPSKEPIMSPAWSKDAKKLSYVSFETGKPQVFVQDIWTGQRQSVAAFSGINGAPAWSPDGSKLALTLSYEGQPEIYIYDLTTRQTRRITRSSLGVINTEAAWSPDGQWLMYTSDRGGKPQIYRLHLASNQEKRVTHDGDYNATPSFSPDGKKIVLVNRTLGQFHIGIQDLDSGVLQVLSDTQLDQSPSFAPNGSMVIYATLYGGKQVLAFVSSDGRFKARLQARKGEVRAPAWSPYLD